MSDELVEVYRQPAGSSYLEASHIATIIQTVRKCRRVVVADVVNGRVVLSAKWRKSGTHKPSPEVEA